MGIPRIRWSWWRSRLIVTTLFAAGFVLLIVGALWVGRLTADDLPCVVLNDGEVLVDLQRANTLIHLPLPLYTFPTPYTRQHSPPTLSLVLVSDHDDLTGDSLFLERDAWTQPRLLQRNVTHVMWSPNGALIGFVWRDTHNTSHVTITDAHGERIGSQALNFGTPTQAYFKVGAQGFSADSAYFVVMADDLTTARVYRTTDFALVKTYGSQSHNFDFMWSPVGQVVALRQNGIVSLITPQGDVLATSSRYYRDPLVLWFGQGGADAGQGILIIQPERIGSQTRYTVNVLHTSGVVLEGFIVFWESPWGDLFRVFRDALKATQQVQGSRRMDVESASDVVASVRSPVSGELVYALIRPMGIQIWRVDVRGRQSLPIIPPKPMYTANLRWLRCSEAAHSLRLYGKRD